jgi:hypothetical protein
MACIGLCELRVGWCHALRPRASLRPGLSRHRTNGRRHDGSYQANPHGTAARRSRAVNRDATKRDGEQGELGARRRRGDDPAADAGLSLHDMSGPTVPGTLCEPGFGLSRSLVIGVWQPDVELQTAWPRTASAERPPIPPDRFGLPPLAASRWGRFGRSSLAANVM